MDPPAVTGSGFDNRYIVMTYNDNNFSEPTRLPFNRTAELSTVSERASVIIAISITAIYSAICALGLLGNVLVMYGVVRYESFLLHLKRTNKQNTTRPPPTKMRPDLKLQLAGGLLAELTC